MRDRLILCLTWSLAIGLFPVVQGVALPQQPAAAGQVQSLNAVPLEIFVGRSMLIDTTAPVKRVSVSDSNVADARMITPTQLVVDGRSPGETTLVVWDQQEHWRSYDVRISLDVTAVAQEIKKVFPDEQIKVTTGGSAIVLSGYVSSQDVAERAEMVAYAYSNSVVNALTCPPDLD